jgi:antitoxin ParD1/3/4
MVRKEVVDSMSVQLTPSAEAMIRQKVESGLYATVDEVIDEALRLLDEHDRLRQLRAKLDVGLAQIGRGEVVPFTPALVAEMKREARRMFHEGKLPSPDVCP